MKIEKARSSDDSPRLAGSEEPRKTKSGAKSKGGAVDSGNRRPSDERDPRGGSTTTNQTGQPTKGNSGDVRGTAKGKDAALPRSSEDEKEDSGTEHDPLLSPDRVVERKAENDKGGGNQPEGVEEEKKAGVENDKGAKVDGEGGENIRASTDQPLADAAGGDSGRFQGMRSRMKKAGKGLLTKKTSASSVRRRKGTDDAALGGTSGKEGELSEMAEGTSSGDTLPKAGVEGMARGTGDGGEDEDGQNQTGGPADDSDTARCA